MSKARSVRMPEELRQMTLGEFEAALSKIPQDKRVRMDFGDLPKGETQMFDCYAARPDELAISHRPGMNDDRMTDADIVAMRTKEAIDCTFIDERGQDRKMNADTPLWVANWRERTGNAVVGLDETDDTVIIRTWKIE